MNLEGNQASIREACDASLLAGAVTMVWQHGNVLQVNEIGYRDVDAHLPMQSDTLFRIASMTKPVTVAAAMSLVDEGKLALRDPIVRWLPEFADVRVLDTEAPVWVATEFKFTGAAVLLREKAAYQGTSMELL